MKKIQVSDQCMGCGICFATSDLVKETSEGKATPNVKVGIHSNNLHIAEELINNCPVNAISIIEDGMTNKIGQEGLKELKEKAIKLLREYPDISLPPESEYKFNRDEYSISTPYPEGQYKHEYSSSYKAEEAAKQEFNRIMYSKINIYIQNIVMEYKVKYMRKYYTCNNEEGSHYTAYNEKVKEVLNKIEGEINALTERKDLLPNNFSDFDVFPDNSRNSTAYLYQINELFGMDIVDIVRREFDKESYHRIGEYDCYWNWDSMECTEYRRFGSREVEKYCYYDVEEACRELAKDIISSVWHADIDEYCGRGIRTLIGEYNKNVRKELQNKINCLEKL